MSKEITVYDQDHKNGTGLTCRLRSYSPAPGSTQGVTLEYKLGETIVDSDAHQWISGFPDDNQAMLYGISLFLNHQDRIKSHPFFSAQGRSTKIARYQLGDVEAEASISWDHNEGWSWQIEYWWPGEKLRIDSALSYLDPLRVYVEARTRFLDVVKAVGGNAYEIETLTSPFAEGEEAPPALPMPYQQALILTPVELDALKAQVALELEEHERRDAARTPEEKEHINGTDPPDRNVVVRVFDSGKLIFDSDEPEPDGRQ